MTAGRPLSKPPYFDIRPRPVCSRGWEWYHPVAHWPMQSDEVHDRLTSIHEASHGCVAIHFKVRFRKLWLEYPKTGRGLMQYHDSDHDFDYRKEAVIALAGREGERRFAPNSHWAMRSGYEGRIHGKTQIIPNSDVDHVAECIDVLDLDENAFNDIVAQTQALVRALWPEILIVSRALLARKTLTERPVYQLLKRPAPKRYRPVPRRLSKQQLQHTATHEAGHACTAIELKDAFTKVEIVGNEKSAGQVHRSSKDPEFRRAIRAPRGDARAVAWIERRIIGLFAGGMAKRRLAPRSDWQWGMGDNGLELNEWYSDFEDNFEPRYCKAVAPNSDLDQINEWLHHLGRHYDEAYRSKLEARAEALVKKLWPDIQRVAQALLKKKVLT